jgi:hypothetical protein
VNTRFVSPDGGILCHQSKDVLIDIRIGVISNAGYLITRCMLVARGAARAIST